MTTNTSINSQYYTKYNTDSKSIKTNITSELNDINKTNINPFSEDMLRLLNDKDYILKNTLKNYMNNNNKGASPELIYPYLNQKNILKERDTQIKKYNKNLYKEYINLFQIIIIFIISLIVIIFINKKGLLDSDIAIIISFILFILFFIFFAYKLYKLYNKDNIDFNKNDIPFSIKNIKSNINNNKNIFSYNEPNLNLNINFGTCVGDYCCDNSMTFDFSNNICVMQENFDNYFRDKNFKETFDNYNIIKPYDLFIKVPKTNYKYLGDNRDTISENFYNINPISAEKESESFYKNVLPNINLPETSCLFTYLGANTEKLNNIKENFISNDTNLFYNKMGLFSDSLKNSSQTDYYNTT